MKIIVTLIFIILTNTNSKAQTKKEIQLAKKNFEGTWVNKKLNRHIHIGFDVEDKVLITDWIGKYKAGNNTLGSYPAFISGDTLILPEDKQDENTLAPYCEITVQDGTLLYRCKASGYVKAKNENTFINNTPFIKVKKT